MGWSIPIAIAALLGIAFLWMAARQERHRTARWDNLRERSKLIAAQLSHLREVQDRKKAPR